VAVVGESFDVASLRTAYETNPTGAVKQLTNEIRQRLEALTLNLSQTEDIALIDTAERIYAREKGLAEWREADRLGERLPRMQAFARGLAWLRANDPERHEHLAHDVKRYRKQTELLGAVEGDVPPKYGASGVAWYVIREAVVLAIGLPLAALAMVFWYPPHALNRAIVKRLNVEESGIATHKLGLAIVLMPLMWLGWILLALVLLDWKFALAIAIVLPLLGVVLYRWSGRWQKVKQDSALFLRVAARPGHQDRLAQQRKELVREFDEVVSLMLHT